MTLYRLKVFLLTSLFCITSLGRDPLTDKRRDSTAGLPSSGLGTLLTELPEDHPVKLSFNQMLKEIEKYGGQTKLTEFDTPFTFAVHFPVSPNVSVFRYNPKRLRAIDALEEILHWEQIKEGGAYWREYSKHPLYKEFKSKAVIMEDLAKRGLLQREDLSPRLRTELQEDLARVQENEYSYDASAGRGPKCESLRKLGQHSSR
jgi:hypothetical protein